MEQVNCWHAHFPPGIQAAWVPQHLSAFLLLSFILYFCTQPLTSPQEETGKNGKGKEKKSFQRKALFKTLDQDYLEALKSHCFLQFHPFPLQDGVAPRKWKTLTFGRKSAVAQSHEAPEQCQGVHPCQSPTSRVPPGPVLFP